MQIERNRFGCSYVALVYKTIFDFAFMIGSPELEREKEERKDSELSVAAFKRQLAALKDKAASIDADIEQYRAVVNNLRRGRHSLYFLISSQLIVCLLLEKDKERSILNSHASHIPSELRSCEDRLAMTIEGVQQERLLIRFFRLDPTDPERDASFVLDISGQNYKGILINHLQSLHLPFFCSYNRFSTSVINGDPCEYPQRVERSLLLY